MEQINRFAVKPKTVKTTSVIICNATSLFRMKTFGPKSLFEYDNERLLDHHIKSIKTVNHDTDIIVTVGHMADKLIKNNSYGVRLIENQLYEKTGIAEEIRLALNATISDQVIIVDGDVFFDVNAFKTIFYCNHSSLLEDGNGMPDEEPGIIITDGMVSNLAYDISPKWGQIAFLTGPELKAARRILNSREKSHLLFHELINTIIDSGGKFVAVGNKDAHLHKINNPKVLKNARSN
jgi:NDP-sugar pyrophosphorylase family protein